MIRILPKQMKRSPQSIHRPRWFSAWSVDSETGIVSSKTKGAPRFQTVIGLEIHAQLDIPTKLFSACPRPSSLSAMQKPNKFVWPFDVGVPGFLPRLSEQAVRAAVLSAAATKCEIPAVSRFERKHYFYADLPLGYQVTQQRWPLAKEGVLVCRKSTTGKKKKKKSKNEVFSARIERIQLEQDTGKTIMMPRKDGTVDSLVDFNRAGSALIEIVFYPDLRSSREASTAVETLRNLLRHIGTCDGKMEEGSLRCDLNVSVASLEGDSNDADDLLSRTGNRVEVKNLNSIRQVQQAAEYEAKRQVKALMDGEPTSQETRTFDVKGGKTVVIRSKGGAKDYRFMPEPDLPPVVLDQKAFGGIDLETFLATALPELPEDANKRLQDDYGLSEYMANVLTSDPPAVQMFDVAVEVSRKQVEESEASEVPDAVANLLCNELFALVREHEGAKSILEGGGEASVKFSKINGEQLGEVAALQLEGTISYTMAKRLLKILYVEEEGKAPRTVAKERGFRLITDSDELASLCRDVIEGNPAELERYKLGGKFARKLTKFFLGKAMAASKMQAHPERLNEVLSEVLEEVAPGIDN